jgi:manganese transport protein
MESAMLSAAIMGGAVHITIIGMHTYNVNARSWKISDLGLARFDTLLSMGFAFGLYSVAIFLVSAAVLHPNQVIVKKATDAALALAPLLGNSGMKGFMLGPFINTSFYLLLPLMLALGLTGTPVIMAIILYLLNKTELRKCAPNSFFINAMGLLTLLVTTFLAFRFVITKLSG